MRPLTNEFEKVKDLSRSSIGFWIALLLSLTEAVYTAVVIFRISPVSLHIFIRIAQASIVAILLDLAVMYFTIKNEKKVSKGFLVIMVANIFLAQVPDWQPWVKVAAMVLVSVEIAGAIYFFSEKAFKDDVMEVDGNQVEESFIIKLLHSKNPGLSNRKIAETLNLSHTKVNETLKAESNGRE